MHGLFSSWGSGGYSRGVGHGLLLVVASLVAEHRLNSCGTWAELTLQHVESSQTRGHLCCLHWQADCPPLDHHGIPHIGSLVTGVAESKLQTFLVILTDHNGNAITIVIFPG